MGVVTGGGGGGGVTPPVTITGTNAATVPLKIVDAAAQSSDSFLVQDSGSNNLLQVGPTGQLVVTNTDAAAANLFQVLASGSGQAIRVQGDGAGGVGQITVTTTGSAAVVFNTKEVDLGSGGAGSYCYIGSRSVLFTDASAAPADGDLSAGDFALWFDATNGAAKLMVKAKQANGTVVAASVALA